MITKESKGTPSAEIIIAIPREITQTSSSLINKDIVEFSFFEMKISKKNTQWVTQAGAFETDGIVKIENYF